MGNVTVVGDFKDANGLWVKCSGSKEDQRKTLSLIKWSSMCTRCLEGGSLQRNYPTYRGCTMSDRFKDFQVFTDWHVKQVAYGLPKYQLDKDLLSSWNKEYNEDLCVLIPHALNSFTANCRHIRSLPQGVTLSANKLKYIVEINIGGVGHRLGVFSTVEEAALIYKKAKEAEAYRWYERLRDGEFVVDGRVIERMRTWTLEAAP